MLDEQIGALAVASRMADQESKRLLQEQVDVLSGAARMAEEAFMDACPKCGHIRGMQNVVIKQPTNKTEDSNHASRI